jgi:hypothetical protein
VFRPKHEVKVVVDDRAVVLPLLDGNSRIYVTCVLKVALILPSVWRDAELVTWRNVDRGDTRHTGQHSWDYYLFEDCIIFKDSVRTAQQTPSVSVLRTNKLLVYSEIIAPCSEIHTKHINTLCGQNFRLLNVKPGGTWSYHWRLGVKETPWRLQG